MSASSSGTGTQGNHGQPSSLRSKVVEILASTANGCIAELGLPQKVEELERMNAHWKDENLKLFHDNQSLTRALHECAESNQAKIIQELQIQNQALQRDNALLMQQNQNLLAGHPTPYHQLLNEHKRFQEQAMTEISILRHNNAILSGRTPVQPSTPGSVHLNTSISTAGTHFSPPPPPHSISGPVVNSSSNNTQFPSHPPPPHRRVTPTLSIPSSLPSYIPKSMAPMVPSQTGQVVGVQQMPKDPKELNIPTSVAHLIRRPHSASQPVLVASSSRPVPPRLSLVPSSVEVAIRNQNNNSAPARSSTPLSAPPIPQRRSYVPVLTPEGSTFPHRAPGSTQYAQLPPETVMSISRPPSSSPSSPMQHTQTFVPVLSSSSQPIDSAVPQKDVSSVGITDVNQTAKSSLELSNAPIDVDHATASEPKPPPWPSNAPVNVNHTSISEPKPSPLLPNPPVQVSQASTSEPKPSPPLSTALVNVNHASTSESRTPPPLSNASVNIDHGELKRKTATPMAISVKTSSLGPIVSTVSILSSPDAASLKRPSVSINPEEVPIHKKPRIEEVVKQEEAEEELSTAVKAEVHVEEVKENEVLGNNEDEDSEDEIRVGADGLRLVEDCVKELVEDDEDNQGRKTCKLCMWVIPCNFTHILY
ncbi:hypothetical protein H0H92_009998 [Tricholoma furcatifolium]|nr:hypothetical protein H0H92_009998 [Tricholoma furcatifolium]